MHLRLSEQEEAFAREARAFFAAAYPQDILRKRHGGLPLTRADHVRSQQALQTRGWFGLGWPAEHGGPGWTPTQRYLFEQALEQAGAPGIIPMAVIYIGPIICAFGTAEQQRRWLPDILESRAMWAQGYSEPEAGSDLASLRMTATRDGDDYVLDGTKIWTTRAHWADWMFCLVRTSQEARKQEGISMICVPMDAPGITIRPIISIDGSHELNQVTFDGVRTPASNRIGKEGRGWHYANVLLAAERISYAHIGRKKADLAAIRRHAETLSGDSAPTVAQEPRFNARLAALAIELAAVEVAVLRILTGATTAAAVSALKILCTELAQKITELWLDLAARYRGSLSMDALPADRHFAVPQTASYFFERAQTIYGGTTEVQKTIIWRQLAKGQARPDN